MDWDILFGVEAIVEEDASVVTHVNFMKIIHI